MAAAQLLDVVCPAAEAIADVGGAPAVRCRIEHSTLKARENPNSIVGFCLGEYTQCPTWRAEKERIWANQKELVAGE